MDVRAQSLIDKSNRGEQLTDDEIQYIAQAEHQEASNVSGDINRQRLAQDRPVTSAIQSGLTGVSQGLTFGFLDEILGVFGDNKDKQQARDLAKQEQKVSPIAYGAGEITGSIASSLPTSGVGGFSSLGQIGKMAGMGAIEGGLYSAGKSESDVVSKDFIEDVGVGAAIGGALPLGMGAAYKGITRGIPQVAKLQALAGLTKEQATLYGDYLEDISKFVKDSEAFDTVIENMKEMKATLGAVKKEAGKLYNEASKEIVPEASNQFLNSFNNLLATENLGKVRDIKDLIPKLDNKGSVNLFEKINKSLGDAGGLKRVVTGKEIHNLRKEADELIKWDRKNNLTPVEERTVKAARNALKDISSPSVKSGDAFFKAAGAYRAIQNKLVDKNGKPTGFLNRLEEGKLKQSELDWANNNFNSLGKTLQEAIIDASDAGLDLKTIDALEDFANVIMKQDKEGSDLLNKIYKFKEFQRTGSLRDISKLVKVGSASILGSPLMGVAVAMADTPSSVLKQIAQIKKGKDVILKAPIRAIGEIRANKAGAPIREHEDATKTFWNIWDTEGEALKELRRKDVDPIADTVERRNVIKAAQNSEAARIRMLDLEEGSFKAGDKVFDIRNSTENMANQFVDAVDTAAVKGIKTLPRTVSKTSSNTDQPFNWDDYEEEGSQSASQPQQAKESFNWDDYKEEAPSVKPEPVVDSRLAKYKNIMRGIRPNLTDEEIETQYKRFSGQSKQKMDNTNAKFGVK